MKRFHVHVSVSDLQQSIRFYSALFAAQPAVVTPAPVAPLIEPIPPTEPPVVSNPPSAGSTPEDKG